MKGEEAMKKLVSVIVAMFVFLGFISKVKAQDEQITFKNYSIYEQGVKRIDNAGTTYKEVVTSEGIKIAYCFNKKLSAPPFDSKLDRVSDPSGILPNVEKTNQYLYILDNGYGGNWNASVIGNYNFNKYEQYYVTQLALWMAQGELNPTTIKSTGNIGTAAYNLYNAS